MKKCNLFSSLSKILIAILLVLASNQHVYSSTATCGGSNIVNCSKNAEVPECPTGSIPTCNNGVPCCSYFSLNTFDFVCNPLSAPECQCNSLILYNSCTSRGEEADNVTCDCKSTLPSIYICDPGYTSCPNNFTKGLCCPYGCCSSDTTKCKCPLNNNCFPNCSQQPASTPTATPSSSSMTCNAIQLIQTCNAINVLPDYNKCECTFSGNTTAPTPTPSNTSSCSKCTSSNVCGVQNYCDLSTQCCTSNPVNCIFGCSDNSQCFRGKVCSSNCCIDDPSRPTITIQLASQAKPNGFKILVKGEKITSLTRCTAKSYSDSFIMKSRPETFNLNKSNTQRLLSITTPQAFKKEPKNNTKEITISVNCDNGASSTKIIGLSN